jgi:hypothetical protein
MRLRSRELHGAEGRCCRQQRKREEAALEEERGSVGTWTWKEKAEATGNTDGHVPSAQ